MQVYLIFFGLLLFFLWSTWQKNVFLLELNNEDVAAKTILLTDIMANAMQPEVNGIPVEQSVHPVTQLTTFGKNFLSEAFCYPSWS